MRQLQDIWTGKAKQFLQKWQYLLLQEKCRLCQRFIHPLIDNMDLRAYAPPAKYFFLGQEIISDALCQFCLNSLSACPPVLRLIQNEDCLEELTVASGATFEDPLKALIYKFKYDGDVLLAKDLACIALSGWSLLKNKINMDSNAICLIPIPLHRKRQTQRGFNQAQLLCWQLERLLNIKTESKLLKRIRNTVSQQELNKAGRLKNVSGAFKAVSANSFANRVVVLVDDVCTSGSTLMACRQAVLKAGARAVLALTVAYVP